MQEVQCAELLAKEQLRRQMIVFAHTRGLGPAYDMAQSISELLSCHTEEYELGTPLRNPLGTPTGALQPQKLQRTPVQGQGCTTPSAYEDYQQQWAEVVEDNRREGEGLVDSDGRERGSRPKKRYRVGN